MQIYPMNFSSKVFYLLQLNKKIVFWFFSVRELCDGLHSNVYLNNLDLRLSNNQLETFIHEYAGRFATIPSLTALDLTGCGKKDFISIERMVHDFLRG